MAESKEPVLPTLEVSEPALEAELQAIWKGAANTRKRTADWRIDSILKSSRAELALRELLTFCIYLGQAFFMLGTAVLQTLFRSAAKQVDSTGSTDNTNSKVKGE